jgi:hypothetical protein
MGGDSLSFADPVEWATKPYEETGDGTGFEQFNFLNGVG